jgi:hypothetical protein
VPEMWKPDRRSMEMTRRKLMHKLLGAGVMLLVGMARRANKAMPRRNTWAAKYLKYPGGFRAPNDIFTQSKWSG